MQAKLEMRVLQNAERLRLAAQAGFVTGLAGAFWGVGKVLK